MESNTVLNYQVVAAGQENSLYLLVKTRGPKGDKKRIPLPLNLSVVIDRSGSMGGDKLAFVKQAAQELVERLGLKDRLSLVSYGDDVRVVLSPQEVRDKSRFKQAIDGIRIQGSTNLSGGWLQGCDFVGEELSQKGVNRVLLLTDGLANRGVTDHNQLAAMARQKRGEGVTTTTFGVGMDYNEDLLSKMANEGGGSFYFIDNPDQAPALFGEELKDLYNVVGQNLTVTIDTEPGVRSVKQLYNYPRSQSGGILVYQLGAVYAEEERCQLFELKLQAMEKGEIKLGQIKVSYDAIQGEKSKKVDSVHEITLKVVPADKFKVVPPDEEVEKLALLQKVRGAREKAIKLADQGEFEQAMKVLQEMAEVIRGRGIKDEELLNEYDRLLEEAKDMEFGRERYNSHLRKMQMYKSSSSSRSSRYDDVKGDLHIRHKFTQVGRERGGPAPRLIEWREGQMDLRGSVITVGSAPDNDIVLSGHNADTHHCRLDEVGGDWNLINLSSKGTIANSGMIAGSFRLSAGDVIRIGSSVLRLF